MTVSVRALMLYTGIFGSLLGLCAKFCFEKEGRLRESHALTTARGSDYYWFVASRGGQLRYAVIRPSGPSGWWKTGTGKIAEDTEVQLRLDGIYVHGQPIPMTARIYIWTAAYTMQPIDLTEAELDEIGIRPDTKSKAWEEKVEPLIDVEYQLVRARIKGER